MISGQLLHNQYATAIDVYSFAILIWELLFEDNPYIYINKEKLFFESNFEESIYAKLTNFNVLSHVEKGLRPVIPFHDLDACVRWCEKFLTKEDANVEVVSNALFSVTNLIEKCWAYHPKDRPSFDQTLNDLIEIKSLWR